VIVRLKEVLGSLGLILNSKKSAVVEFMGRRCKSRRLPLDSNVEGIPVMLSYRYLGLHLDSKLTITTHLNKLKERLISQAEALGKVLFHYSAGYRKDLWRLLVRPLSEFPALLCVGETNSNIITVERLCKKTFKRMVGFVPNIENELVEMLSGYSLRERGAKLWLESEEKWRARRQRLVLEKRLKGWSEEDLLAYAPCEVVQLFNLLTRPCPICKDKRMDPKHLLLHNIDIPHPMVLLKQINIEVNGMRKSVKTEKGNFKRGEKLRFYGAYCKRLINRVICLMYKKMELE